MLITLNFIVKYKRQLVFSSEYNLPLVLITEDIIFLFKMLKIKNKLILKLYLNPLKNYDINTPNLKPYAFYTMALTHCFVIKTK